MARRTSTKLQPSVRTLTFPIGDLSDGNLVKYIDLSQAASLVNRRFYRQGLNWAVSGFTLHTSNVDAAIGTGSISIAKIPNTWVVSNAWEKAFRAWNKQQMETIEDAGGQSAVARFRDFKVFADTAHVDAGIPGNMLPGNLTDSNNLEYFSPGEWEASEIVVPNIVTDAGGSQTEPREYTLHMCGVNNYAAGPSRGIVEGYADSRAFPQSPDPVSPSLGSSQNWLRDMFDVGNDNVEIIQNATDRNDNLPYPQTEYPGGENQAPDLQYHDNLNITTTTVSGKTTCRGTSVPAGLLKLRIDASLGAVAPVAGAAPQPIAWIQVHLVPGSHRGYMCEPMTEM